VSIQNIGNYGGSAPVPVAAPAGGPRAVAQTAENQVDAASLPEQPSSEQLQKAVDAIKKSVGSSASSNLQFSIDNETGRTLVRVVDQSTGQTIRQIPTEEVLAMAKAVDQMKGVLLKQQA
jgi:flagellar protein FlaG